MRQYLAGQQLQRVEVIEVVVLEHEAIDPGLFKGFELVEQLLWAAAEKAPGPPLNVGLG